MIEALNPRANRKVVLIGWDGATFDVLRPMVAAGVMPTLRRLLDAGAWGTLRTTRPPVTCPAWPTMFTGVNPGKHGVFSFSYRDPQSRRMRTASGADVRAPKIWDLLCEAGHKVGILNVPITFPADVREGVMLSGFVSPDGSPKVLCPESLNDEFRTAFDPPYLNWDVLSHRPADPILREKHIESINRYLRIRNCEFEYLLDRQEVDFCFLVHEYTDRVQHLFYHLLDPGFPAYARTENRKSVAMLQDGFRELDASLGRLIDRFGPEADYLIVSDHGFGGVTQWIYINNLLALHGFLQFKGVKLWADALTRRLNMSDVWRSRLGLFPREPWHRQDPECAPLIDYRGTLAFAGPQLEHSIYINVKGRPQGIVEPGNEYEDVREQVVAFLRGVVDPATNRRVFEGVWTRDELYDGPYTCEAPDIIYELAPGYMVPNYPLPRRVLKGRFLRGLRPGWDISGYHRPDGVLIAAGPDIRQGQLPDSSICDIAPTVLYLMDQPIPNYMDGRVLDELVAAEVLESRSPVESARCCDSAASTTAAYTGEEQALVTQRLEDLGYL